MLFPVGAIAELASDAGRRRPIAFYDALNGDVAAYYDEKTILAGDLDDLLYELLDRNTCDIRFPVHWAAAHSENVTALGLVCLELARIESAGESGHAYTCRVSVTDGSVVLCDVTGKAENYPRYAIESGLNAARDACERVPRCCVFCRYANYEAIGSHSTGELLCYLPRKQRYDAAMDRISQDVRATTEQLLPICANLPHVSEFGACGSYTERPQEWGLR